MVSMVALGTGLYQNQNVRQAHEPVFLRRADHRKTTLAGSEIGPLVPMEVVVRLNKADCNLNILDRMELI